MSEEFLQLIESTLDDNNEKRAQSEAQLQELRENQTIQLFTTLLQILESNLYTTHLKAFLATIIYSWRLYPDGVQDLPKDGPHPFEVYTNDLVVRMLTDSFNLMVSPDAAITAQIKEFAAVLYSRIGALHAHRDLNSKIIATLTQAIVNSQTVEQITPLAIALKNMCESFIPDDEELTFLMQSIFQILSNSADSKITCLILGVLRAVISSISEVIQDEQTLSNILTTLLDLFSRPGVESADFEVFNEIYKAEPAIIKIIENQLIEVTISILADETKDADTIKNAARMVKQIAKLAFTITDKGESDEETALSGILQYGEPLIISLLRVCSTVDSPTCDYNGAWLPYMAASQALKGIVQLLPDEALASIFPMMQNLINSAEFNERFAGLCLLSHIIKNADNSLIGIPFLAVLFERINDQASIVAFQSIKCIQNLMMRFFDSIDERTEEEKGQLSPVIQNCYEVSMAILSMADSSISEGKAQIQAAITKEGHISPLFLKAASLLSEITRMPQYPHTQTSLQALLQLGLKTKEPKLFECISKIIDLGTDQASVVSFFPVLLEALSAAIQQQVTFWAMHDIGENIQAYLAKYAPNIQEQASTLMQILFQAVHSPDIYANDALIPLGMATLHYPSLLVATPNASEDLLKTIAAFLEDPQNSQSVYNASMALSFVVMAAGNVKGATAETNEMDFKASQVLRQLLSQTIPHFFQLLLPVIANFDIQSDARSSSIGCIASLVDYQPELILPVLDEIIKFIRTFTGLEALAISVHEDKREGQLLLDNLAKCILSIMKAVGLPKAMEYKDIAYNIILTLSSMNENEESIISRLMITVIHLLMFLAQADKNFVLEIIEVNPEIGHLIINGASEESDLKEAKELLILLGYQAEA